MDGHLVMNVVERDGPVEVERPDVENAQVNITRPAEEEQSLNNVLDANAGPWSPSQLNRAILSQAWKLNFPLPKKLLILDVNGLLVARYSKIDRSVIPMDAPHGVVSKSYMFKRPFCDSFLAFCFENFDVGLWSSMMQANVFRALDFICQGWQDKCRFVMHQGDCTNTGLKNPEKKKQPLFLKELMNVWSKFPQFNETNTLLIDDTPYKALRNPPYTAIFPEAYLYNEADIFLKGPLVEYLTQLRDAVDVREFVRAHPIGMPALAPGSLHWDYFQRVLETKPEKVSPLYNAHPPVTVVPQTAPTGWDVADRVKEIGEPLPSDFQQVWETRAENGSPLYNTHPPVTVVPQTAPTGWDVVDRVKEIGEPRPPGFQQVWETKAGQVSPLYNTHPPVTVVQQTAPTGWDVVDRVKGIGARLPPGFQQVWETKDEKVSPLYNTHPPVTVVQQTAPTVWDFVDRVKEIGGPLPPGFQQVWETKAENVSPLYNTYPLVTVVPQTAPTARDFTDRVNEFGEPLPPGTY